MSCYRPVEILILPWFELQTDPPNTRVSAKIQFALYQFIEINTKLQHIEMHGWYLHGL